MKAIFGFLITILVLGISSNSVAAQPVYPDQTTTTAAIDLNNFDVSTETKQKISTFFDQCPAGIILYKYMGEMYVYCLLTPISGILHGLNGQQIDVDIKVDDDNKHDGKKHHNDNDGPDRDCLFNPSLSKCAPNPDGECPDDFNMNEDGQCFPDHPEGCPDGTHSEDDDESGRCIDDEEGCPDGMEMVGNNCTYVETDDEQTNEEEQPQEQDPVVITPDTAIETEETQQPDQEEEPEQEQQQQEEDSQESEESVEENDSN